MIGCSPRRNQHQRRFRCTAPAALVAAVKAGAPTSASRSTATPTACSWSTDRPSLQRRRTALSDGDSTACRPGPPVPGAVGTLMTKHGGRGRAEEARRGSSSERRSVTATSSRNSSHRGTGSSAAKAGHLLALDKHTTGDGIVSALMVLAVGCRARQVVGRAAFFDVQLFPQTLINVQLAPGSDGRRSARLADTQADVDRGLGTGLANQDPALSGQARGRHRPANWPAGRSDASRSPAPGAR